MKQAVFECHPRHDRVLIARIEEFEKERVEGDGMIVRPAAKQLAETSRPMVARVVAVGPGRILDDGTRLDIDLSPGDVVLVARYAGHMGDIEGFPGLIHPAMVKDDEVLAVIRQSAVTADAETGEVGAEVTS